MDAELEALLKAWEAVIDSPRNKLDDRLSEYFILVEALSNRSGKEAEKINEAIQKRFLAWQRAQQRPPTMPPKA
jgi:hypothetical protein